VLVDEVEMAPVDKQTESVPKARYSNDARKLEKVNARLFLIKELNSCMRLVFPVPSEQFLTTTRS
jgi:hypothetical protein